MKAPRSVAVILAAGAGRRFTIAAAIVTGDPMRWQLVAAAHRSLRDALAALRDLDP